jgi:hypothetical protein
MAEGKVTMLLNLDQLVETNKRREIPGMKIEKSAQ